MSIDGRELPLAKALTIYLLIAFGVAYIIEFKAAKLMLQGSLAEAELMLAGIMYAPTLASFTALLSCGVRFRDCINLLGIVKPKLRWILYSLVITYSIIGACVGILLLEYGSASFIYSAFNFAAAKFLIVFKGVPTSLAILVLIGVTVIAGLTINAFFALGEEIGWRGFLYMLLYNRLGYVATSLLIGLIWGLWHAPLIALLNYDFTLPTYYSPAPPTHILLFCLFTTSLTFIMIKVRNLSGSVIPPAIIHGTFNAIVGAALLASLLLPEYMRFPGGLLGFASTLIVSLIINLITYLEKYRTRNKL